MPQKQSNRRVGVLSQRLSDEESPSWDSSEELLSRFLSSVDFSALKPPRTWETNPLYKELKRSLQGTIHMQQVDEMLREKYRKASSLASTHSGQSLMTTISSHQSHNQPDSGLQCSGSIPFESDDHLWWTKRTTLSSQSEDLRCDDETEKSQPTEMRRQASEISICDDEMRISDRTDSRLKTKSGLEGLEAVWKLRYDEPVHLMNLCQLMDLDKREIERREEHILLEIKLMGHLFCVKSEIFGLYNVEVPVNGEMSKIPRVDRYDGVMSAHIETNRRGLRMIYTWDRPAAATRRDNYEVSADGERLTLTAYLMQRDGHYCKVKWQFEKQMENA